jgi:hypothetical protein
MKMVAVNIQLPEVTDKFYRRQAKQRLVSKSAVIRDVLMKDAQAKQSEKVECAER